MIKLSWHQQKTLTVLNEGGKITLHIPDEAYLDTVDNDGLKLRVTTFRFLMRNKLIEVTSKPSLGVQVYGITDKGKSFL